MIPTIISITLLLFIPDNETVAKTIRVTEKSCQTLGKKINRINSRLRVGYGLTKGERMKTALRKLKKHEYACWKKRLSTR